jgi:hypothetical protein
VSAAWLAVIAVGAATIAIKGAGPLLLGGRPLPPRLAGVVDLLAPTLLAALVATAVLADGKRLVLDARLAGLAAAAVALRLRAPLLAVIAVAAVTTALVRAVF